MPNALKNALLKGQKISLRGDYNSVVQSYALSKIINSDTVFTMRGYHKWIAQLSQEARLSTKEVEYIISKIDPETMDFISGSKLRYGTNVQLDYVFDSYIELLNDMERALTEIDDWEKGINDIVDLVF